MVNYDILLKNFFNIIDNKYTNNTANIFLMANADTKNDKYAPLGENINILVILKPKVIKIRLPLNKIFVKITMINP